MVTVPDKRCPLMNANPCRTDCVMYEKKATGAQCAFARLPMLLEHIGNVLHAQNIGKAENLEK